MTDIEKKILERVEAFAEELSELVRQVALEQITDALGGNAAPAAAPRARRATSAAAGKTTSAAAARRSKGQKRAPEEMDRLLRSIQTCIQGTPGIRADQIAQEIGVTTRDTNLPIKKLLANKAITKKGQKRATQYFPAKTRAS